MSTEQEKWAAQIREIPAYFRIALLSDDHAIRQRPAAVEVVGHMIDKIKRITKHPFCFSGYNYTNSSNL